jgi:hypothetical protein
MDLQRGGLDLRRPHAGLDDGGLAKEGEGVTCVGDLGERAGTGVAQQERAAEGDGRRGCNSIDLGAKAVAKDVPEPRGCKSGSKLEK